MNTLLKITSILTGFASIFLYAWVAHTIYGWYFGPIDYKTIFGFTLLGDMFLGRNNLATSININVLKRFLVEKYHITDDLKEEVEIFENVISSFCNLMIPLGTLFVAWIIKFFV